MNKLFSISILLFIVFLSNAQLPATKWAYIPQKRIGGFESNNNIADQVVDNAGNIYTLGSISGSGADMDPSNNAADTIYTKPGINIYISKINNNGKLIFIKYFQADDSFFASITPKQIALDKKNNLVIFIDFFGKMDLDPGANKMFVKSKLLTYQDMAVIKLSNTGDFIWGWSIASASSVGTTYKAAAINSNNDIVINANIYGTTDIDPSSTVNNFTGQGQAVLYYDENGKYKNHSASTYSNKYASDGRTCAVDANDDSYTFSLGSETTIVYKHNKNGSTLWTAAMGSSVWPYTDRCKVETVLTCPNNDVIIMGNFINVIDFDLSSTIDTVRSSSNLRNDGFIVRLNSAGKPVWKKFFKFVNTCVFGKSFVDANNNLHVVGNVVGMHTMDGKTIGTSSTAPSSYYAIFSQQGVLSNVQHPNTGCTFSGINSLNTQFVVYGIIGQNNVDVDLTNTEYLLSSGSNSHFTAVYGNFIAKNKLTNIDNKICVFPNPTNGNFTYTCNHTVEEIQMINAQGKLVLHHFINSKVGNINASQLSKGVYSVVFISKNGLTNKTLVIN